MPMPSRTVVGAMNGKTRKGPGPTPQTPSVCPKSSRLGSMPHSCLAMSQSPPIPTVELMRKRASSRPAPDHLPWSTLFTNRGTKLMLVKPRSTIFCSSSGMTKL